MSKMSAYRRGIDEAFTCVENWLKEKRLELLASELIEDFYHRPETGDLREKIEEYLK